MNQLKGIHHVSAVTSSAEKIYDFFTNVLGMRLVKKTVNQDDIRSYHLFFADDKGTPGTDMTFFDVPGYQKGSHGTNEIHKSSFRVPTDAALDYWLKRFDRLGVSHSGINETFGAKTLSFVDFDDQQYQLISDENDKGIASGTPWKKSRYRWSMPSPDWDLFISASNISQTSRKRWKMCSSFGKSHKKVTCICLK